MITISYIFPTGASLCSLLALHWNMWRLTFILLQLVPLLPLLIPEQELVQST